MNSTPPPPKSQQYLMSLTFINFTCKGAYDRHGTLWLVRSESVPCSLAAEARKQLSAMNMMTLRPSFRFATHWLGTWSNLWLKLGPSKPLPHRLDRWVLIMKVQATFTQHMQPQVGFDRKLPPQQGSMVLPKLGKKAGVAFCQTVAAPQVRGPGKTEDNHLTAMMEIDNCDRQTHFSAAGMDRVSQNQIP